MCDGPEPSGVGSLPNDEFIEKVTEELEAARKNQILILDEAADRIDTMPRHLDTLGIGKVEKSFDAARRRRYATLTFDREHVEAILAGDKTVTLRLPEAYDQAIVHAAEQGAEVLFETPDGRVFARASIRAMWAATARQVAGSKLAGYPTEFSTPDDVLDVLEKYYEDELADADATQAVDVLHFDVVESYREVSE